MTRHAPAHPGFARGVAAAFALLPLAAIAWVGYAVITSRMAGWSSLRVSTLTALPALVVILIVWAVAYALGAVRIDAQALPAATWRLAYVSLIGVVIGMCLWNDGLQRIGSVNAMLLLNLMLRTGGRTG